MKNTFLAILVGTVMIFVSSCSTKFNIAAPYKSITVIYGFLDQADTAHYIRVQKAFLDDTKSALTMAKDYDSSFYTQLNVKIERINTSTGQIVDTIHLNRVDLNLEGYPKDSGVFFNTPNYAYKFTNPIAPYYNYRIVVTNGITGVSDSAETPIIDDKDTLVFTIPFLDNAGPLNNKLIFSSTLPGRNNEQMYGSYIPAFPLPDANPVGMVQGILRFNWVDSNGPNHTLTPRHYDYDMGYQQLNGNNFSFSIRDLSLYYAIQSGMGCTPAANVYRLMGRCQLFVYLGTYDLYQYWQRSLVQGTGLTGSEIEPIYTNIKGKDALGLFTSRGMRSGYITIETATMDSLYNSSIINGCCNLVGTH